MFPFAKGKEKTLIGIDFGCGPGRNLVKYAGTFKRLDGTDISENNLANACDYLEQNNIKGVNLYLSHGNDLGDAPSGKYDFVMSTICMQHIAVHEIRFQILKDMYRVLKPGGWSTIQMGFGKDHPRSVGYNENYYYVGTTNGRFNTRVEDSAEIKNDLLKIGFHSFEYDIDKSELDKHSSWIYFRAQR